MRMLDDAKFLWRFASLGRNRFRSRRDYFEFQKVQAERVCQEIIRLLDVPEDSFVIDFGCGQGGYTDYLSNRFQDVLGVDYFIEPHRGESKALYEAHDLDGYVSQRKADLIFCSSVIEHIKDQDRLLTNMNHSLKDGGYLYLSFPPFWSPVGGHAIKPLHYLPERLAMRLAKRLKMVTEKTNTYADMFETWGLYRTTIAVIRRKLIENGFGVMDYNVRYCPINFARIPLLGEILAWHVEFYCQKKSSNGCQKFYDPGVSDLAMCKRMRE